MNPILELLGRRLRLAVIGGGPGSFIGPVHRTAARLDDRFEIVAGVLSGDASRSRVAAAAIGVAPDRAYADWRTLLAGEKARGDGADAVAVMTPNDSHHAICAAALEQGFEVICDKPLTTSLVDALDLVHRVRASGRVFCLTHNYTAYPMVRQARDMVRAGVIGPVRQIQLAYVQGHNATLVEGEGSPNWRFDPDACGPSLVLGDIGTHAHHLGAFVSGLELEEVMAEVWASVPGRRADDDGQCPDALVGRRQGHDVGHQRGGRRRPRPGLPHLRGARAGWNGGRSSPTSCATAGWAASSRR